MTRFDDISPDDELPELWVTLDRLDLVKYAAGSGDFNPLHYDADFPQARSIGDNIVHGRLKFALMGRLVSEWLAHDGWIREMSCQYRGMDLRGRPLKVTGRVVDVRTDGAAQLADLELAVVDADGRTTTPGEATVVFRT